MSRFRRLRPRSIRAWLAIVVIMLAALALGGYIYAKKRTGSIYHPNARFTPEATPTLSAAQKDRFSWPLYGYSSDHTRYFPAPARVRPPFRKVWAKGFGTLLEFPPVMRGDHLFQLG